MVTSNKVGETEFMVDIMLTNLLKKEPKSKEEVLKNIKDHLKKDLDNLTNTFVEALFHQDKEVVAGIHTDYGTLYIFNQKGLQSALEFKNK